jgi:hypothetical protein
MIGIITIFYVFTLTLASQNILQFGAIPNEDSLSAQLANQKAINKAIARALLPESFDDSRIVVIPKGKYYSLPIIIKNAHYLTIEVQGKLIACNKIKNWPKNNNGMSYQNFIDISNSTNI